MSASTDEMARIPLVCAGLFEAVSSLILKPPTPTRRALDGVLVAAAPVSPLTRIVAVLPSRPLNCTLSWYG
jgi:hypothetical protein